MRIACPNCDAEYEVDASVIPDSGRDVQCSNCGTAWFQLPPSVEAELEAEEALFTPAPVAPQPEPAPAPVIDEPPAARSLDDSLLAVLREEAERESAARRAEAPPVVEVQPELGLAAAAVDPVARRIARLKGIEPEPIRPAPPPKPAHRRDLLPEIEEINSTLRAASEARGGAEAATPTPPARRAQGFRNGFLSVILLAGFAAMVYTMAPRIAAQIPAAAPTLNAYVQGVDKARLWLDGRIKALTGAISGDGA